MNVQVATYQTIKGPTKKAGAYAYILLTEINGKTATLTNVKKIECETEHSAELKAINDALGRITKECNVLLILECEYICTAINEWLENWAKNGWKTAKGAEIKNAREWQQLYEFKTRYSITACNNVQHEYKNWLRNEAERMAKT